MAKTKEAVKEAPKGKAKEAEAEDFEYTVEDLVDATGLQPASIRVGLRESDFERTGKKWGWNSEKEFNKVVAYFKERADRKPTGGKAKDDDEDEKPAAKGKSKDKAPAAAKPSRKK